MFDSHPVNSLLDNDLYKFTMQQFVLHQFPGATAKFKFKCRTPNINLAKYEDEIANEIYHPCDLYFKPMELDYLESLRFLSSDYIDFLEDFRLKGRHVFIVSKDNGELDITIEGPWVQTILWEVYILKIVHEVYSRNEHPEPDMQLGVDKMYEKIHKITVNNLTIVDFGSRRAFSSLWHKNVVGEMLRAKALIGTSNVFLAKKFNTKPIGTMAHEVFQACQGLGPRIENSQKFALQKWAEEYRGDLGIALTDTLGIDKFLDDFDMYFAKLFDGVRHDSGDPLVWGDKMISHYKKLGIDPMTKSAVFSDGLNVDKAIEIRKYFKDRINVSFGIGTNLTNDLGYKALQIVIKMTEINGYPCAKISDTPAKTMCKDKEYLKYLRSVI